jgi:hypothetical protein
MYLNVENGRFLYNCNCSCIPLTWIKSRKHYKLVIRTGRPWTFNANLQGFVGPMGLLCFFSWILSYCQPPKMTQMREILICITKDWKLQNFDHSTQILNSTHVACLRAKTVLQWRIKLESFQFFQPVFYQNFSFSFKKRRSSKYSFHQFWSTKQKQRRPHWFENSFYNQSGIRCFCFVLQDQIIINHFCFENFNQSEKRFDFLIGWIRLSNQNCEIQFSILLVIGWKFYNTIIYYLMCKRN